MRAIHKLIGAARAAFDIEQQTLAPLIAERAEVAARLSAQMHLDRGDTGLMLVQYHNSLSRDAIRLADLDVAIDRARAGVGRALGRLRILEQRAEEMTATLARREETEMERAAGR